MYLAFLALECLKLNEEFDFFTPFARWIDAFDQFATSGQLIFSFAD